jgi:uncharacterized damage-inducible protein DinB
LVGNTEVMKEYGAERIGWTRNRKRSVKRKRCFWASAVVCSTVEKMKDESRPATSAAKGSKAEIIAYLKSSFDYCDGAFSAFTDAHLNDRADFWGFKTNKMFILTQAGNHDALHYGNLVTYLRLNGLEPSGGWF